MFWECNFNVKDVSQFGCKSQFWLSVVEEWARLNFSEPIEENEKINQIIWYNSYITVNKKMLFWKEWYERGIHYVKDLLQNGKIMTIQQLNDCYDVHVTQMQYNSLISAIPKGWGITCSLDNESEWQTSYVSLIGKRKVVANCLQQIVRKQILYR